MPSQCQHHVQQRHGGIESTVAAQVMVTSPMASMPSVTDLTENSINSLGTPAGHQSTVLRPPDRCQQPNLWSRCLLHQKGDGGRGRRLPHDLHQLELEAGFGCCTCSLTIASRSRSVIWVWIGAPAAAVFIGSSW